MFELHIRHCRVKIHFSIFVLLAFLSLFAGIKHGVFLMISVLLHEFAHLGMMFHLKKAPSLIVVSGLGLRIQLPFGSNLAYKDNIKISLAGPLMNLLIGGISLLFQQQEWAFISFALGIVHLLPIEPLDGGLALRAFFSLQCGAEKARKITFVISLLFLFPMLVFGFIMLLQSRNNFSLLALSVYLMIYLVVKKDLFMA
ncbi:hypothetical protein [Scatolibacter rhodanostii]|uniref:hypothetical protein n=1 Tax=Scatolibacter rhodanostii TaxID=2014781 RepID=UPI000C06F4F6|nr:hypothetical protein [Scatolibacter rhodanostii]